jgi:hypothetical protein
MTDDNKKFERARTAFVWDLDGMIRASVERATRDLLTRTKLLSKAAAADAAFDFADVWTDEAHDEYVVTVIERLGQFLEDDEGLGLTDELSKVLFAPEEVTPA